MAGWRREILNTDRAFEEVYKALVKGNHSLIINESRTELTQRTYHSVGSKSFSNDCSTQVTTATNTLQILECSNSEYLKEKSACCNTSFLTHSDIVANPGHGNFIGHQSRNNSIIEASNLKIQHEWPLTKDTAEQDSLTWTSYDCSDEKSNLSDNEPLQSYDCISDDDGIQSGEGSKNEEVCQKCCSLYYKVSKNEFMLIKDASVIDPNHWSCNYWMMSNPLRRKSASKGQKSDIDFRTLLKYLRAQAQLPECAKSTTRFRKCSRLHVFLERNLQSGRNAKQNANRERATDIEYGRVKCSGKLSKSYVFELDSNLQAKDTFEGEPSKEPKCNVKPPKKKKFRRDKDADDKKSVPSMSEAPVTASISGCENTNSSNIHQNSISRLQRPNSPENLVSNTTDSFVVEELSPDSMLSFTMENTVEEGSEFDEDGDSNPFPWFGSGRFRELVAQMNSRPSSSVVREYSYL